MSARRTSRGSVIVEFALVVPLVVLMIFGVVQYGYHYWAMQTAAATAREAARRLVVGTDEACTIAEAVARAEDPAVSGTPTVEISYDNATDTAVRGVLVTVTVRLQSLDVGLLPVPGDGQVVESATNRVENVPIDPLLCNP